MLMVNRLNFSGSFLVIYTSQSHNGATFNHLRSKTRTHLPIDTALIRQFGVNGLAQRGNMEFNIPPSD